MTITTDEKRAAWTAGLRDLADWLDAHPEMDLPYINEEYPPSLSLGIHPWHESDERPQAERFAAAVSALGGRREKAGDDEYMRVHRDFGPVRVQVWTMRDEVCEAVVVGTETVEVQRVVQPAVTETVTEEREVIEWRCTPVLEAAS